MATISQSDVFGVPKEKVCQRKCLYCAMRFKSKINFYAIYIIFLLLRHFNRINDTY